jgi:hypothetical protein
MGCSVAAIDFFGKVLPALMLSRVRCRVLAKPYCLLIDPADSNE